MKKLLLSLGAVAAVVAPVAAVVACGTTNSGSKKVHTKHKNGSIDHKVTPKASPEGNAKFTTKTETIDQKISETLSPNKKIKVPVTKKRIVRALGSELDQSVIGLNSESKKIKVPVTKKRTVRTTNIDLEQAIIDLNTKLAEAVKQTVESAVKANPNAGKYTELAGMKLVAVNSKDWNIEIKVVTSGYFNADKTYYTTVPRDGYVNAMVKPMLSYKDASSGLPIAIELTRNGIDKFFKLYAHGGLSLSLKDPATTENTGFKTSMKLINEFFAEYGNVLSWNAI